MKVREAFDEVKKIHVSIRYLDRVYDQEHDEHMKDEARDTIELLGNYLDLLNAMLDKAELKV